MFTIPAAGGFDGYEDMYDPRLKPRMLRALVADHLRCEEGPVPSPSEMSSVVSTVRHFRLLSESLPPPPEQTALADQWKASVDAWVDRVIELVSCDLPDKNWVGIYMLGLTCTECSPDRFLAWYPKWLDKLLSHIEPPSDFQFVKVASCNSISDLLMRLGGYVNVNKQGISHAGKVLVPVLKLLSEDTSGAVLEGAVGLFCTIITFFPTPVLRHYSDAEAIMVTKILSGRLSIRLLKKYAQCLALLPKSKGDEEYWSLLMEKILVLLNFYLSDAFQGLEARPTQELTSLIGSQSTAEEAICQPATRSKLSLTSTVTALMFCCCTMLMDSYPAQVIIPVRPLLALIKRVLMVDGSFIQTSLVGMPVQQQEFITPELPILHANSLDLLVAVIKGLRSRILPHTAEIIRLLTWYFKKCALPTLRIKLYSIFRILLTSMGTGIALQVAGEVLSNACIDLDAVTYGSDGELSNICPNIGNEASLPPIFAKWKQTSTPGSLKEHHDGFHPAEKVPRRQCSTSPISLKVAALEALDALLTVGGNLGSESLRSSANRLLMIVAISVCHEEWDREEKSPYKQPVEPNSTWADFQLAALRALLASFLSSAHVHPHMLSQGFELFQKGKQETGTKLADFCAHALLVLDVLMHPRFLPLADLPSQTYNPCSNGVSGNMCSGLLENCPTPSTSQGIVDDPISDIFLDDNWLKNSNEADGPCYNAGKDVRNTPEPFKLDNQNLLEELQLEKPPEKNSLIELKQAVGATNNVQGDGDEALLEVDQFSDIVGIGGINISPLGTLPDSLEELK